MVARIINLEFPNLATQIGRQMLRGGKAFSKVTQMWQVEPLGIGQHNDVLFGISRTIGRTLVGAYGDI